MYPFHQQKDRILEIQQAATHHGLGDKWAQNIILTGMTLS